MSCSKTATSQHYNVDCYCDGFSEECMDFDDLEKARVWAKQQIATGKFDSVAIWLNPQPYMTYDPVESYE